MAAERTRPQANAATTTRDPRITTRSPSARPIPRRIYLVDNFQRLDAWIVDLSQSGLAVLLPEPLQTGELLFIELESTPEVAPVKVWAGVTRCTASADANWLVGCEFVNHLSADELEALQC
jgi:hypothetical protein